MPSIFTFLSILHKKKKHPHWDKKLVDYFKPCRHNLRPHIVTYESYHPIEFLIIMSKVFDVPLHAHASGYDFFHRQRPN